MVNPMNTFEVKDPTGHRARTKDLTAKLREVIDRSGSVADEIRVLIAEADELTSGLKDHEAQTIWTMLGYDDLHKAIGDYEQLCLRMWP